MNEYPALNAISRNGAPYDKTDNLAFRDKTPSCECLYVWPFRGHSNVEPRHSF